MDRLRQAPSHCGQEGGDFIITTITIYHNMTYTSTQAATQHIIYKLQLPALNRVLCRLRKLHTNLLHIQRRQGTPSAAPDRLPSLTRPQPSHNTRLDNRKHQRRRDRRADQNTHNTTRAIHRVQERVDVVPTDGMADIREREVEDQQHDEGREVDPGMGPRGREHYFEEGEDRVQRVHADVLPRDLRVGEGVLREDGPEDD